jgi:hypothetical protein
MAQQKSELKKINNVGLQEEEQNSLSNLGNYANFDDE